MGTKGQEIITVDIDKVLNLLNQAFSSEWLAYYQYWLGAKVAVGPMKGEIVAELSSHANDELSHANQIADRIRQLGGILILAPTDWSKLSPCQFDLPEDPYVIPLLEQNIAGEQCAIVAYKKLMELTEDKDDVTYNLALSIFEKEVEHEEDLQRFQEDLRTFLSNKLPNTSKFPRFIPQEIKNT